MRERAPRSLATLALISLVLGSRVSFAQAGLVHLEDATLTPRGLLRVRAVTAWTRYDSRFTAAGVQPLGSAFTADSLGGRQLAALGTIDSLIESAAGSAFTLSVGRSRLDALAREEAVPIGVEYGITNRLSVGVIVPVVRRRVAVQFRLDSTGANVGPNRHRVSQAAQQTNTLVQVEFASAAAQLQSRLQSCQTNQSGSGCAQLLSRQAEAQQLIAASQGFAASLADLYGSGANAGMPFVPIVQSAAQVDIELRVADFNDRYRDMLGTSDDVIGTVPVGAGGPAGTIEFQEFVANELGRDSIVTQERSGIGDVEIGLKALILDRPVTELRRLGARLSIHTVVRLPTGSRQSPSELADLRLGKGPLVDGRVALDVQAGRAGLLTVGEVAFSSFKPQAADGLEDARWMGLHVAPRWHITPPLSFHAAYSFLSSNQSGAQQYAGGGVSFSTLAGFRGEGPLPLEMRYTHLEALSGQPGQPKYFRDQIELRIYYRLLRR